MIIVLAFIAAIIGWVLPSAKSMREETREQQAKRELKTISSAINTYYMREKKFPADIGPTLVNRSPTLMQKLIIDPYRTDAANGGTYGYDPDPDADSDDSNFYVVYSWGPDKNRNWVWDASAQAPTACEDDIIETYVENY